MEESFEAILNKLKMSKISTNGNFSINLNGLPNPFFKNSISIMTDQRLKHPSANHSELKVHHQTPKMFENL